MRRRTYIVGAAIAACPLAIGVAMAPARAKSVKSKSIAVTCSSSVTTQIPAGQTAVIPPVSRGTDYGTVRCGKFGRGVQFDSFTVPDAGDQVGDFTRYFGAGSVHGTYDLTPDEGAPVTTTSFESETYTGTFTVVAGTGVARGYKGTGTLTCSTPDSLHLSCNEKGKLTVR